MRVLTAISALFLVCSLSGAAQQSEIAPNTGASASSAAAVAGPEHITRGSKVFIEPMDGFENYLSGALLKKQVPVTIVDEKSKADFVITGSSRLEKAGWAKTIFVSPNPHAAASIAVKDAHTGTLVFAYNVDKQSAMRGDQSTAEACAKHLKEAIEKE